MKSNAPKSPSSAPEGPTEARKLEILREEQFRAEARRAVAQSQGPRRFSVWKALNQPFTLFVLSSIAVAGITSWLQGRTERIRHERETRVLSAKTGQEIHNRAVVLKRSLRWLDLQGPDIASMDIDALRPLTAKLGRILSSIRQEGIYREFDGWSLATLVRTALTESDYGGGSPVSENVRNLVGVANMLRDIEADMQRLSVEYDVETGRNTLALAVTMGVALELLAKDWDVSLGPLDGSIVPLNVSTHGMGNE